MKRFVSDANDLALMAPAHLTGDLPNGPVAGVVGGVDAVHGGDVHQRHVQRLLVPRG